MYEDQTQNYDPEIHEKYLIHDTPSCHIIYNYGQTIEFTIFRSPFIRDLLMWQQTANSNSNFYRLII